MQDGVSRKLIFRWVLFCPRDFAKRAFILRLLSVTNATSRRKYGFA